MQHPASRVFIHSFWLGDALSIITFTAIGLPEVFGVPCRIPFLMDSITVPVTAAFSSRFNQHMREFPCHRIAGYGSSLPLPRFSRTFSLHHPFDCSFVSFSIVYKQSFYPAEKSTRHELTYHRLFLLSICIRCHNLHSFFSGFSSPQSCLFMFKNSFVTNYWKNQGNDLAAAKGKLYHRVQPHINCPLSDKWRDGWYNYHRIILPNRCNWSLGTRSRLPLIVNINRATSSK